MSVESIANLNAEISQLKKQLDDAVNQANGFVSQLDAHKSMLSEVIGNYLNAKAAMIMSNKHLHESNFKLAEAERKVTELSTPKADNVEEIKNASNKVVK